MSHAGSRVWRGGVGLLATAMFMITATGCASAEDSSAGDDGSEAIATAGDLTISDPWVKAAEEGMTAAFGILVNDGDADITVVSADSPISPMEIHEIVMADGQMQMRNKDDGLTVPAGGSHTLEPGGDHLMLMDLAQPVAPGDEVTITLHLADGDTVEFTAVGKPFAGGDETYDHDHDHHDDDEHHDDQ